jgi:hypothetical protein
LHFGDHAGAQKVAGFEAFWIWGSGKVNLYSLKDCSQAQNKTHPVEPTPLVTVCKKSTQLT